MEMNGIAHISLSVTNFEQCAAFYRRLFEFLDMKLVYDLENLIYGVGSRTGVLIRAVPAELESERFNQDRAGLHHYCFRARSRDDIDSLHVFLEEIDACIVHPPEEGPWAPGYYSVLFEDPAGLRIEANYVSGKGNLDPSIELPRKERHAL